eukprot:767272-Hanusia_phi.AAC.6
MELSHVDPQDLRGGLVLVGADPPKSHQLRELDECKVPTLWVEKGHAGLGQGRTFDILKAMNQFTQKHDKDDTARLEATMEHIQRYIDLDGMLRLR